MTTEKIHTITSATRYFIDSPIGESGPTDKTNTNNDYLNDEQFSILHYSGKIKNTLPIKIDHYGLLLCIKGSCQKNMGPFSFEIVPYSLHFVTPRYLHSHTRSSDDLELYIILFKKDFLAKSFIKNEILEKLLEINPDVPPLYELNEESFTTIFNLFTKIENEYTTQRAFFLNIIRLIVTELLYEMSRACEKCLMSSTRHLTRSYQLVYSFKKMVDENFIKLRSVQQYADELHISAKHLSTTIKAETGQNALQHINMRMHLEAEYLLTNSSFSIKEISEKLGFDNSSHFARFFKQFAGISPSSFQQLNAK